MHGLEFNDGMFAQSSAKFADAADVTVTQGSILEMPFADAEFDVNSDAFSICVLPVSLTQEVSLFQGVMINQVIHHLDDTHVPGGKQWGAVSAAFAEVFRVLKPGGVFCLNHQHHSQTYDGEWARDPPREFVDPPPSAARPLATALRRPLVDGPSTRACGESFGRAVRPRAVGGGQAGGARLLGDQPRRRVRAIHELQTGLRYQRPVQQGVEGRRLPLVRAHPHPRTLAPSRAAVLRRPRAHEYLIAQFSLTRLFRRYVLVLIVWFKRAGHKPRRRSWRKR